ncbi:GNAT family N-acetyltransferase [Roseibium denhamense]|uniref:Acetyltransferase (GNAT) family protein n=1 Tax=Roseibium denhamense TaxID=76305 RepID=A0ABY1PCX1_9HYPH|nr:GNAT family N-acetyltransferase [Roseibium denhamense]MTI04606.1 GNAT family N-acetyltransferase [Roseibium denhamense]SMP31074.1 Acetyltransferase (GNAT) family protein [Roseibium denhamense]
MAAEEPKALRIEDGFPEDQRGRAARLFWDAFQGKLGKVMGPATKAVPFLEDVLNPDFAISAIGPDGTLLGLAGYKTSNGALVGGGLKELAAFYGWAGGFWRGMVLDSLERQPEPDCLLMDGIFVDPQSRGLGVGSALLDAVCGKAEMLGHERVRLDVIDTNTRARALYERRGFQAVSTEETGIFAYVFGFSSATRMEKHLQTA